MRHQTFFTALLFSLLAACASPPDDEISFAVTPGAWIPQADYVLVSKSEKTLTLFRNNRPIRQYIVAVGRNDGPKIMQGDGRTPEGMYVIDGRKADSFYTKALHISYPNRFDIQRASYTGKSPGGAIMIHGVAPVHAAYNRYDRTDGCIAVTNREIEELWQLVPNGTPIEIRR